MDAFFISYCHIKKMAEALVKFPSQLCGWIIVVWVLFNLSLSSYSEIQNIFRRSNCTLWQVVLEYELLLWIEHSLTWWLHVLTSYQGIMYFSHLYLHSVFNARTIWQHNIAEIFMIDTRYSLFYFNYMMMNGIWSNIYIIYQGFSTF